MNKLDLHLSKTLKLTNVLKYKLLINEENFDFNAAIEQMQSYLKVKGSMQIGPLIQYTRTSVSDTGSIDIEIVMMLQCNNYIHSVEAPYSMESVLRVSNAMYCRYIGPEDRLKLAYDKINVEAFEADVELENCNYTIYVDKNEEKETIVADVFVPRKDSK